MAVLLALASVLALGDLIGDALGDGSLTPPTAAVLETVGGFDLETVEILDGETLSVQIGMVSVPSQLTLIEVYLDVEDGGANATLPGSGMSLPEGSGWEYALRITRDGATAFVVDAQETESTPGSEYDEVPVELTRNGRVLTVHTPFAAPTRPNTFAVVGLFDPFGETPWRPLASQPSPWAFSSHQAKYPVVDLLAATEAAQQEALELGILPVPEPPQQRSPWMAIMVVGIVLAAAGLTVRVLHPWVLPTRSAREQAVPDEGPTAPAKEPTEEESEASPLAEPEATPAADRTDLPPNARGAEQEPERTPTASEPPASAHPDRDPRDEDWGETPAADPQVPPEAPSVHPPEAPRVHKEIAREFIVPDSETTSPPASSASPEAGDETGLENPKSNGSG